jgi:antitoxin ParD1/3/4
MTTFSLGTMDKELTVTITEEEARLIEERVHSGAYASADDVVRAALGSLDRLEANGRDETERFRRLIQESLDDPRPNVPIKEAFEQVRARIAKHESEMNAKT